MSILLWIILATLANGFLAFVGALTIWLKEKTFRKAIFFLVAFSAGTLFSGALFHLTAEALEEIDEKLVFPLLTFGFSLFFIIEKLFHWRHCHKGECEVHPVSYLVLMGDGIHNFIDGVVIAASFFVGIEFGIITTALILIHELPQELGDFAILVHSGFSKAKALLFNFFSQVTCVVGGIAGFYLGTLTDYAVYILPFAAGGFLYISASDLVPELHKESNRGKPLASFFFFILGIGLMVFLKFVAE